MSCRVERDSRRFERDAHAEEGFTLIELLITVAIIGILAAISLPALTGQRLKAQDIAAKSDIRNARALMESCFAENATYFPCDEPMLSRGGYPAVYTYGSQNSGTSYYIEAVSKSGTRFGFTRLADGSTVTKCYYAKAGGGCPINDGPW